MPSFRITRDENGRPTLVVVSDDSGDAVRLGVRLDLPPEVGSAIAAQYRAAVEEAPAHFADNRNEEDSISGSFGTVLRGRVRGNASGYEWRTAVKKVRGRGPGAGEKRYGADLAIEIQITIDNETRRKTLLVQSKKNWDAKDAKLADQARQIADFPGSGIVVDYRPDEYRALSAEDALRAGGDAREVPGDAFRDLGEMLGVDFLACRVGSVNVYYDVEADIIVVVDETAGTLRTLDFAAEYLARTTIRSRRHRFGRGKDGGGRARKR
jgi:hypothetical protein